MRELSTVMLAAMLTVVAYGQAEAEVAVFFDQDTYTIDPYETVVARVLIDMDNTVPGNQPSDVGLGAIGLKVTFNAANALVASVDDIVIPSEFSTVDGFSGDPEKTIGDGYVSILAALDALNAVEGYKGDELASITFKNLSTESYSLGLELLNSAPTANFVDFDGNTLDGNIAFGTAVVQSVPEPSSITLLLGAVAVLAGLSLRAGRPFGR